LAKFCIIIKKNLYHEKGFANFLSLPLPAAESVAGSIYQLKVPDF